MLKQDLSSTALPYKVSMVNLPNFENTKCSIKENGVIKAYGANTNQGIIREYNEDRVSIVLNI